MGSKQNVLQTLIYGDIFDYPLSRGQLWQFLIAEKKITKQSFEQAVDSVSNPLEVKNEWFYLAGRASILKKRLHREKISQVKFRIAKRVSRFLSFVPTVYLVGVSGALAVKNADEDDDIDLFIIAQKNTMWTTRLISLLILEMLGLRRKRKEKNAKDKVCLNMIVDEKFLALPFEKQNLYTAHEVAQMVPLVERENIYRKFIKANLWVKNFLPNALKRRTVLNIRQNSAESFFSVFLRLVLFSSVLEWLAKKLQLWYMRRHRTTEITSDHMLAFHPFDYQEKVLEEYKKRLKKYEF